MDRFKLATYNIRLDTPLDKDDLWKDRKQHVIKIIEDYGFDIFGLQEVKETQKEDLQILRQYNSFGVGRSEDEDKEYNSIYYRKDKFHLMESDTFWLSETEEYEEKGKRWHADYPRICTWGKFRTMDSSAIFNVFNTHFDHMSKEARYQSAQLIIDKIKALHEPVIVMGDLNGDSTDRFYPVLASHLHDSVKESRHHVGPTKTCTGVTFDHSLEWDKYISIDYIFVDHHFSIDKTEVITDRFHGKYPSDHFPVCIHTSLESSERHDSI